MCLRFHRDIFDWTVFKNIEQLQKSVVTHQVLCHFNQKPTKVMEENLILSLHHTFRPKLPQWNICSLRGKCFHWSCHGTSWSWVSWSKLPADLWNLWLGPQNQALKNNRIIGKVTLQAFWSGSPFSYNACWCSERWGNHHMKRWQLVRKCQSGFSFDCKSYVFYPLLSMFEDCYYGLESGKACKTDQQCGCHFPQTLWCQGLNYLVKTAIAY